MEFIHDVTSQRLWELMGILAVVTLKNYGGYFYGHFQLVQLGGCAKQLRNFYQSRRVLLGVTNKAVFHIRVAPSPFRCSVCTFSKKHSLVGRLKQSQFSVGTVEAKHFSVGNIQTKTPFCE